MGANYSLEESSRIREECIAALERESATAVVPEIVSKDGSP